DDSRCPWVSRPRRSQTNVWLAVTKKSHLFQISNRSRISDWQIGQIRSPYARLIMGVSSFTQAPLVGAFFLPWEPCAPTLCGRGADRGEITTQAPKRLPLRLRPT